jgi:hypothetical protein
MFSVESGFFDGDDSKNGVESGEDCGDVFDLATALSQRQVPTPPGPLVEYLRKSFISQVDLSDQFHISLENKQITLPEILKTLLD